jgi:hypothetical protein
MGYSKWREKNMVTPSWDNFSSPQEQNRTIPAFPQENQQYQQQQQQQKKQEQQQKGDWGNYQSPMTYQGPVDPTADEEMFDYLIRGTTRLASRAGEQALGAVGNTKKFVEDLLVKAPESGGLIGKAIAEFVGPENWKRLIKGTAGESSVPTSGEVKQFSQEVSGEYTSPRTKGEAELDELTEDVASTFITRGAPGGRLQRAANHFLIPAAANVTKKVVNDLGFGEDNANLAKMAVWLPLSMTNNVNASRYASELMNRGRNGFNPNLQANVPIYQNRLNAVSRNMLQGDPRSALAQQQIAGIMDDMASGRTSMRDLMTRYDAINAAKRDRGLFQLGRADRAAAVRNINQVRDVVREQINALGAANPQALQDWQNGVQAWATIHRSNALTNAARDLAKGPYAKILTGPAAALFGLGSFGVKSHPLFSGGAGATAAGIYKSGQVLYRMMNDPNLANYYWTAVNALMQHNAPAFFSNYDKLNKKLEESEPVKPKSESKK